MAEPAPHGTPRRYRYGPCHCNLCRAANAAAARQRRRDKAYGRYRPDVDAEPVRRHVRKLREAGLRLPQIAALADLNRSTVATLLQGRPPQGVPPTRKMRAVNADRLLAIRAEQWIAVAS